MTNNLDVDSLSAAFDSRNEPKDVWDACLSCIDKSMNYFGQRDYTINMSSMHHHQHQHPHFHHQQSDLKETNSYIAQKLNNLSISERNHALDDLHGVATLEEEGKEFLEKQLYLLDIELGKIKEKGAYSVAKSISENYVSNPKFCLQFLRAELFNAKNAASRMVEYFKAKLSIFGKEKLAKDITLRDLPEEDLIHFKKGFFQPFSAKDSSGRLILCSYSDIAITIPIETRRRILWYNYNTVAEDEVTQRKGVVLISYSIGQQHDNESRTKVHPLITAIPVRFAAIHFCFDEGLQPRVLQIVKLILGRKELGRIRIHYSSRIECAYTLITFGIPRTIFNANGEPNTALVLDWVQERMLKEKKQITSPARSSLIVPDKFDVLFGRGKRIWGHPGNVHCRELMDIYKDRYEQSSKLDKNVICLIIASKIKDQGGRFLKEVGSGWTEVDDEVAKTKISHDYRNNRRSAPSLGGRRNKSKS